MSNITNIDNFSMADIVENKLPDSNTIESAKNQMKIFFIASAKKELKRVIKLTETLDKLEDIYQQRALNYIEENDNDEVTLMVIPNIIQTISSCLLRSNTIIRKVIEDEKLFNLLIVNDLTVNNTNNVALSLEKPESRNKVRELINSVINNIDNINISNIIETENLTKNVEENNE